MDAARRLDGEAGEQQAVAGHIAGVLAGLIGATDRDIIKGPWREARLGDGGLHDGTQQIIGSDLGQRACMAAEG